jgi:hypothetical protein
MGMIFNSYHTLLVLQKVSDRYGHGYSSAHSGQDAIDLADFVNYPNLVDVTSHHNISFSDATKQGRWGKWCRTVDAEHHPAGPYGGTTVAAVIRLALQKFLQDPKCSGIDVFASPFPAGSNEKVDVTPSISDVDNTHYFGVITVYTRLVDDMP